MNNSNAMPLGQKFRQDPSKLWRTDFLSPFRNINFYDKLQGSLFFPSGIRHRSAALSSDYRTLVSPNRAPELLETKVLFAPRTKERKMTNAALYDAEEQDHAPENQRQY